MRYADAEAFRAALEARLRQASTGDQDLARRRRIVAFDRFLARLAVAAGDDWVLKGGAALEFRMPDRARATRDIDLALTEPVDPAHRLLDDLEADPFEDHFSFRVTRRRELSEAPDRSVVTRLSLEALLGGRVFERFVVDLVGTDGASTESAERVELGRAFAFADLPIVELAVLDLRTHWAEKLSAYLRRYDDRPNTRVKDLVDLVLLIEHGLEPDAQLHQAVTNTFAQRQQELPDGQLPSMADEWAEPFEAMAADLALGTIRATDAHSRVERFWQDALQHDQVATTDSAAAVDREPQRLQQSAQRPVLRLIGYWLSESDETPWPDPKDSVDPTWSRAQREIVADYLVRGRTLEQYRGLSPCRFCGEHLGSKELTDRTYCWPEGLAHYLTEHAVRLPDEFVAHVETAVAVIGGAQGHAPEFDHLGQRLRGGGYDDEYEAWSNSLTQRLQADEAFDSVPSNWLEAEITHDWWLRQVGWAMHNQVDQAQGPVSKAISE